ncbi:uncharacterized protein LOC135094837 [Scylla paramamosain]|uniref:uncharacterized protein LOC135094837 n=1 Tax=Scylla paramamosain TaxID=85552 RepID=UPI00308301B7
MKVATLDRYPPVLADATWKERSYVLPTWCYPRDCLYSGFYFLVYTFFNLEALQTMPRPKKNVALRRKCAKIVTKASSVAAKRKRQAASGSGDAPPPPPPPPVASCSHEPTSAQKRKSLVTEQKEQPQASEMKTRSIFSEETVKEIVESMLCPSCSQNNATATFTHHQIDTYIQVECSCGHVIADTKKGVQVKEHCYPMTTLLVYCMMMLGVGYAGVDKLISFFSLHHFTRPTYIRYARFITDTATDLAKSVLEKSRHAVCDHYASKQDVEQVDGMPQVSTTFDGSWHKRGHKSNRSRCSD